MSFIFLTYYIQTNEVNYVHNGIYKIRSSGTEVEWGVAGPVSRYSFWLGVGRRSHLAATAVVLLTGRSEEPGSTRRGLPQG